MSSVYFFDYTKGSSILQGMKDLFVRSSLSKVISPGESVAVKLHMGERGNNTYVRPFLVNRVVELVKEAGGEPFVTDTTVLYPGPRHTPAGYMATAAANGFTEASMGARVVIADEEEIGVTSTIETPVAGCEMREVDVASGIYNADSLLVLSHTKAHPLTGFAGALKNVGMGCVTKKGKSAQHQATVTVHDKSKCTACGICVETCPFNALSLLNEEIVLDIKLCTGCCACVMACPNGAHSWSPGYAERFMVNLVHAAYAVLKNFKRKVGFINFIQDVATMCDCAGWALKPVIQDIGILASLDPVAIDKASLDLIDQAPVIVSPSPASSPDLLGKIWGVDSLIQFRTATELGLGSLQYDLVTL